MRLVNRLKEILNMHSAGGGSLLAFLMNECYLPGRREVIENDPRFDGLRKVFTLESEQINTIELLRRLHGISPRSATWTKSDLQQILHALAGVTSVSVCEGTSSEIKEANQFYRDFWRAYVMFVHEHEAFQQYAVELVAGAAKTVVATVTV